MCTYWKTVNIKHFLYIQKHTFVCLFGRSFICFALSFSLTRILPTRLLCIYTIHLSMHACECVFCFASHSYTHSVHLVWSVSCVVQIVRLLLLPSSSLLCAFYCCCCWYKIIIFFCYSCGSLLFMLVCQFHFNLFARSCVCLWLFSNASNDCEWVSE